MPRITLVTITAALLLTLPLRAQALERICDTAFEDCRAPLLALIDNETVAIDVAFWFMEDARYSAALARAAQRGVRIRVIFDSEALPGQPDRQFVVDQLVSAGIPMREKVDSGINHWKLMLFVGQNTLQFSGGNHTAEAFVPIQPYVDYVDEVIYFTEKPELVNSFKTKFDDVWTSSNGMLANYEPSKVTTIERAYPIVPIDPQLNFPPFDSFRDRSVATYRAETQRIDAIIYRITDRAHTDTLIENVQRGVGLRLITEPFQYRDESRLWHSWNVDRLYMAGLQNPINGQPGIQIRHRLHAGLTHEKLSIMIGQGVSVLGSSNWTSASSDYQLEHNLFTGDPVFFAWSRNHFERKWNNLGPSPETEPFVPLPPDTPALFSPGNNATQQPLTATLQWHAGPWAHKYDVFIGTDPNNLVKVVNDQELGPYDIAATVNGLTSGTRYYWRVVSRTMANLSRTSPTWSFVTQGTAPGNSAPAVTLTNPLPGSGYTAPASITLSADASDIDGVVTRVDFLAGTTVVGSATTAPFTATWADVPAGSYSVTARAVDNLGATTVSAAATITVSPGSTGNLPAPWAHQDVGGVGIAGSASISGGTWSITGSGTDVWGTADQFQYVYQPLTGDGTVIARVATVQNADQWVKAGVMIRETLAPGSTHAFMIVTPGTAKGLAFQRRTTTDGASTHTAGGEGAPPSWVKLTRVGSTFSAYRSADGVNWTLVGTDTIPMATTVLAGLAVTAHNNGTIATATFDSVSVTPAGGGPPPNAPPSVSIASPASGATFTSPASITLTAGAADADGSINRVDFYAGGTFIGSATSSPYAVTWSGVAAGAYSITARATDNNGAEATSAPISVLVSSPELPPSGLPSGWASQDIGAVGAAGSTTFNSGAFTLRGSGADIWGTADEFQFAYRAMTGDGTITAHIQSIEFADRWTKAGVMMRASLAAGSRQAMMIASPGKGFAFQRRLVDDSDSVHTAGPLATAPAWVRLQRSGSTITASISFDGVNWTVIGADQIDMPATIYVGLPLTSHNDGVVATAVIDSVSVAQ